MGKFKFCINFKVDKRYKIYCFLPTLIWEPRKYRYNGQFVFDITWLNFHIGIGLWEC